MECRKNSGRERNREGEVERTGKDEVGDRGGQNRVGETSQEGRRKKIVH